MTQPSRQWRIDADGWLSDALRIESPNYDARPAEEVVSLVVIHAISLPPGVYGGNEVIEFFTNQLDTSAHPYFAGLIGARVSAHFFIRRTGEMIQFVSCSERAWHAGSSRWAEREHCNDYSLGIELEGNDWTDFTELQYRALAALLETLKMHYPIAAVVGHADIAPGRKTDPGPHFDWNRVQDVVTLQR